MHSVHILALLERPTRAAIPAWIALGTTRDARSQLAPRSFPVEQIRPSLAHRRHHHLAQALDQLAALGGRPRGRIAAVRLRRAGLFERVHTFEEAGAAQAYCGDPAAGTAAEGRELIERLSEMVMTSMREAWPDLFERV